jgi:4-hydroxy-4-methyl-2-oxoglutarate aldolase
MTTQLESAAAEQLRQRYLRVDTSNVADVLDGLGLPDQGLASSFTPYPGDAGKLAGWAYPIQGEMRDYPLDDRDPDKMNACAGLYPGSVSVWAGSGEGVCFFGELIAIGMKERGCAGALVDGGVRDVAWLGRLDFPVFARYRTPVQSIGRWKVVDSGAPVQLPGATTTSVEVRPGDFILADADGAIVIPAAVAEQVLARAEALGDTEVLIRSELENGLPLANALAKFGHV